MILSPRLFICTSEVGILCLMHLGMYWIHYSCKLFSSHYYERIASSIYSMLSFLPYFLGGGSLSFLTIIFAVVVKFLLYVCAVSALVLESFLVIIVCCIHLQLSRYYWDPISQQQSKTTER